MPITVAFHEEKVIHFKLIDPFTMDDLFKGFAQSNGFRDIVKEKDPTRRVHTLLDMMETRQAPPGILQGRQMPALTHTVRGEIVIAVKNAYARSIAETMLKVMRAEGHFFDSLDSAWEYLNSLDSVPVSDSESNS
jgi:hypothetical protein